MRPAAGAGMLVAECAFAPRSLGKEIMDGQAMLEALSATGSRQARSVRSVNDRELSRTGARHDH